MEKSSKDVRWRDDRAAEGARLEVVCTRKGTVGSNPTLSVMRSVRRLPGAALKSYKNREDSMAEHVLHKKDAKKVPQKSLKEKRQEKKDKKKGPSSNIPN